MAKRRPVPLSLEQMNAICCTFIPIADQLFENMKALEGAGFAAWRPYHDFIESFADNPAELEVHRKYQIEAAKHLLTRPWSLLGANPTHIYISPFIEELRIDRDKMNGVADSELSAKYGGAEAAWRREVDPCLRRKVQASINDKAMFEAQWLAMLDEQRWQLEAESFRFKTAAIDGFTFDPKGRFECFQAVMTQYADAHGFSYDMQRSDPDFPVFFKPLCAGWDICWILGKPKQLALAPTEGRLTPELVILGQNVSARSKVKVGHALAIRYQYVIAGFGNAYQTFHHLGELETAVRAHLFLYGLMAPIIEQGARMVLKPVSDPK